MPAKGDHPAGRFLTGCPSVMARLYRKAARYGAPDPGRLPSWDRLRTIVMERISRNDVRNACGWSQVEPTGPGDPFYVQGCGTE
jgi:hypothetical protein